MANDFRVFVNFGNFYFWGFLKILEILIFWDFLKIPEILKILKKILRLL